MAGFKWKLFYQSSPWCDFLMKCVGISSLGSWICAVSTSLAIQHSVAWLWTALRCTWLASPGGLALQGPKLSVPLLDDLTTHILPFVNFSVSSIRRTRCLWASPWAWGCFSALRMNTTSGQPWGLQSKNPRWMTWSRWNGTWTNKKAP